MPDKKYLIEIPGREGVSRLNEADWASNKDAILAKYPNANVVSIDMYDPEDIQDNDAYLVSIEGKDKVSQFTGADWLKHKDAILAKYPKAQVSRMRGVDYYYDQANELGTAIEEKNAEIEAWQNSIAERTGGSDWSAVMLQQNGLKPIGTGLDAEKDEAIAAYVAEGEQLQEQKRQLQEAYDNNPRVKAAREEWEKNAETEFARYQKEYLRNMRNQITSDMESDVDMAAAASGKLATQTDGFSMNYDSNSYFEKQKLERYQSALQFYDKAEEARAGQLKGFWKGVGDVAEHTFEQQMSQKDIATYADIFTIMQKLEKKYGTLKDVSEEQIERSLEPSEKALLKAYFEYSDAISQNSGDKKYKAGQQAGQWAQFAIEFALGGKVADSAAKGLSKGVVAGLERWAAKALQGTFKGMTRKALAKAGTMATRGLTNVAIATALRPSTYTHMTQAATTLDKRGHLNPAKEMSLSFLDDAIETVSEKSGEVIGKVLGVPLKPVKKWTSKAWDAAFGGTKFGEWGKLLTNGPVADYLKQAGFDGYPIEILEEYVGNAMRLPMDSEALKNMHRDGNGYAMLVGFLPATLIGGGISVAQFGFAQKRATNSAAALKGMLINKGFGLGRSKFLSDYKRDMSPLELGKDMYELKQELEAKGASQDELQMVSDYATAVAEYQTLRGGMKEMQSKEREQVMTELKGQYKQFYKEDENGNKSVELATDKNGRQYFITSSADFGVLAAIDKETGAQVFLNESDINISENVSLDNYLDGVLQGRRELAQMERMTNERDEQIAKLSELLPKTLNLGTKGTPNEVVVKGKTNKGVSVVDAAGNEMLLSWEQVGRTMGMPIEVLTDAQIAEAEAAAYGLGRAEKKAQRATTQAEADSVQRQGENIAEEVKNATPKPEDLYRDQETGEVDENAFWENDPEGYCQWNDSEMQDNGADSLEQIESGMAAIAKRMAELDKMASDDPKARKVIKAEKTSLQNRLDRLTALQQGYTQAPVSEEQRQAEQTIQYRERIDQWRKMYGVPIFVYESIDEVNDKGAVATINQGKTPGWQNSKGVHIYLPHVDSMEVLEETLKHETTGHAGFALLDEKSYNELMDKVWAMMSDSARNTFYNYASVANTKDADARRRKAAEEFASHVAEQVDLGKASAEQKTIWERIVDFFRRLFSDDNLDSNLIANAIRDNHLRLMEKAQQAQQEVDSFKAEAQEQTEQGLIPEEVQSDVKAADGTNNYSTATYHSWVDNLGNEHIGTREEVLTRMQNMGFSEAEIKDMAQRMDTAYAYMEKLRRLTNPDGTVRFDEFNKWAEKTPLYKQIGRDYVKAITSLVSNGDYPVNLEITTDCIKREAFTQLLNELVKRGAELSGMGPGEIVTIQKMMKQYGIEVACNLCFVEGKRLQIINWASQIVNDWNDALVEAGVETDEFFEFGKDGDAFIPAEEWRTYEDKSKVAKVMRNLDDIALLFQGLDPKTFKAQKRKNKKALDKYIKEKAEKAKKPIDQWKPSDEQKREMKKIANEGLYPTYVNENMEEYRNAFNAMRNEWLDKNPNADPLSFNPTQKQWDALGKIRNRQIDNVRAKMVRLIMEYPEMRKKMTLNDLLGSKGLMEIRQQHGQAYADLYSIILQRFGTGTPKPVQDAVPYDGEVMTLSESAFKKANEIGGARLFSFSDFDITKVFDYMQMFFDLEANRQMLQSYTKEVAAVLIFGRSNAKFNISTLANAIVPDSVKEEYNKASEEKKQELRHKWAEYAGLEIDADGNIVGINFSEEHSVSPAFAQQIFHDDSRNKDCGAIMVGASVNHAIFSAAQQWIRMVIPFHLSGMPMAAREKTDVKWYTDNTAYQSTRKKTKDGWSKISSSEDTFKFYNDMNKEGWNMRDKTREYLAWCAEKGFRPKFDWGINSDYYRAYCEENGYTPNQQIIDMMDADTTDGVWNQYYKFLTDFTAYKPVFNEQGEMIDEIPSPQLPVQSNFDFSEMEKDVLFEGERSMLEHREGNIQRTNRHIEILAEQATAYLNGDITEEDMGLRDDVHFENTADAERYLEEVAKENGVNMYKTEYDRTPPPREAVAKIIDYLFANKDRNKGVVERRVISSVTPRQIEEYRKKGIYNVTENFVHSIDNSSIRHKVKRHGGDNRTQEPLSKEEWHNILDVIENFDRVDKQKAKSGLDVIVYQKRYDDGTIYYVEEIRTGRESLALTTAYKKRGDSSGLMEQALPPTSETTLDNTSFDKGTNISETSNEDGDNFFKTANNNQAIFVSNAAKAVEGIKMEKATPEQWLKMIEKNGGLKAGEDKWMGLSDFLKSSDKKTLTKQEVLDFVNEHMIQIEEQHYGELRDEEREVAMRENMIATYGQEFYDKFVGDAFIFEDPIYGGGWELAINNDETVAALYNEYSGDKVEVDEYGGIKVEDMDKIYDWATSLVRDMEAVDKVKEIHKTRKKYTTSGLTNNHEIALTVPTIEPYKGSSPEVHFYDAGEGRAVAWVRFGDASKWVAEQREDGKKGRTKKVLVIDEIQSQRHQDAREVKPDGKVDENGKKERIGYRDDAKIAELKAKADSLIAEQEQIAKDILHKQGYIFHDEEGGKFSEKQEYDALTGRIGSQEQMARQKEIDTELYNINHTLRGMYNGIPAAPFENNWHELAMKRMLRYAAENGYDVVAWTKGEQQAERYGLKEVVNDVTASEWDSFAGWQDVKIISASLKNEGELQYVVDKEGKIVGDINDQHEGRNIAEVFGKEIAVKLLADGEVKLSNAELILGSEGMKGFYDKMLPAFMNKYGKKWGVKVEDIHLNLEGGLDMHSIPVTEEMKESVMEGQTMFKTRRPDQSAMSFTKQSMRDYVQKYGNVTYIEVMPVNEDTARELGYTLEELKVMSGVYRGKKGIAIFAREKHTDSDQIDTTIYHESVHHLHSIYPELDELAEHLWDNADEIGILGKIKKNILALIKGEEDLKKIEMLAYSMEYYAGRGEIDDLIGMVSDEEARKLIEFITNKTKYGRFEKVREDSERGETGRDTDGQARKQGEGSGNAEGENGEGTLFKTAITPEVRREMDVISAQAIVNGNYMKAPNGKDSKLTPEQWALVRTKNFKRWFGDWELPYQKVSKVKVDKIHPLDITKKVQETKKDAVDFAQEKNVIRTLSNEETNGKGDIIIGAGAIRKIVDDAYSAKERADIMFGAIAKLPEIIKESKLGEEHFSYAKGTDGVRRPENGINEKESIFRYFGAIENDGETYRVKITVKRDNGNSSQRAYTYEVMKIELTSGNTDANNEALPTLDNSITFAKLLNGVENDKKNGEKLLDYSKVVDENGEPKVVYHQTNSVVYINKETGENWDELDWRARQEWDERDDWDEYWEEQDFNTFSRVNARTTNELDGFFFAPEYDEYHEYGDRTIPAFLNIKNPASREDYNIDSSRNNAGRDERIRLQNEGFDGVIREEDGEIWEYVAFNPNQIKSATDNTGEFSEDEDIRFKTESNAILQRMKDNAETLVPRQLTEDIWKEEIDGKFFSSPIGNVKFGNNQYGKYIKKGREKEFGMLIPTIERPDIIFEEYDPQEGAERQTKYAFVKTFYDENGEKHINYASISILKDGMEVVTSNHRLRDKQVLNKIEKEQMLWNRFASDSISSAQGGSIDQSNAPSENKGTNNSDTNNNSEENLYKTAVEDYATMPVDELVEKGKMRVSAENQLAADEFMDRIRTINGALDQLRMAAAAQRKYDQNTVKILASLANDLLASGKIADPTKGEVKRLVSVLNNATGKRHLEKSVERLMDIMIYNQLRHGRENLDKFLRIRGKKVDARGVEVKGRLDIPGQQIMDAIRDHIGMSLPEIEDRIAVVEDNLTSESEIIRRNAENELVGLGFAKQYVENIKQSENEEKSLRKEILAAEAEYKAGARDRKSYTDFAKVTEEAIRENRTQRVLAYQRLIDALAEMVTKSIQGSKLFNEAEKERVAKIQHFANSDMIGMPADAHQEAESKFWNNGLVRLFTSPLATFEQWLRVFGAKSPEGKGYLYNHFMGSWAKATDQFYLGMKEANAKLDAKAREVFGNKVDRWSDLFAMEKELSKGRKHTITIWDDGEKREYEVTQGNLLYIYMVDKMIDGKMKLRKMGISEYIVEDIVREIDPRFITLADWIQNEFLPGIRDKYNAVHERLFGAPMAAIDNYFPIKVLANARVREVDLGAAESSAKPSTITGSIIKRTRNSLALDVLHADALDVVLEHIEQMEQWAAFAEFNRDLNTLLSYKKFRNRVQNMSGVLGAGKEAWNSFRETAEIAAGVYQPKTAKADKLVTNAVKGLTAGKISFRLWTAMKQVLAMPAFLPYVNPAQMVMRMATPWESWNWAMENLPAFEKRWKSREAGNVRLKKTEADYKIWQGEFMETATRLGMTPNAFVDAITCAIGSHSVFLTQKERYERDGYDEEQAIKKAKLDAMVVFNATQQSSESAFLSAVQSDRTFIAHALTVFRNNSFGMQREFVDALRNFRKRSTPGFKVESIEFMKKQMVRDGLTEDQAERAAERVYNRSAFKDAARMATFGFLMQFLWNLGGSAIYLLFGDDDEEKDKMIKDAAIRGAFGSVEGLGFGNVITEGMTMAVTGDLKRFHPSLSPAGQDIESLWSELLTDPVAGVNELINILIQAGIGANPQVLTDAAVAIYDACDGDIALGKEIGIALLRILQAPQSQIDKLKTDEIDFTKDKGLDITIAEFAKEYAEYKKLRNAPLTNVAYSDEQEKKIEEKYIKRFLKDAEELKRSRGNEEAKKYYEYLDTEYKEVTETINSLKRKTRKEGMKGNTIGAMEYAEMLRDYTESEIFQRYSQYGSKARAIERLRDKMMKVDPKTRETIEDAMLELRREMVEEMESAND